MSFKRIGPDCLSGDEQLVFCPEDAIMGEALMTKEQWSKPWGFPKAWKGQAGYNRLDIDSAEPSWQKKLQECAKGLAAGEPLILGQFLGGMVYMKDVTTIVSRGETDTSVQPAIPFQICILDVAKVAMGDFTPDHVAFDGDTSMVGDDTGFCLPKREYVKRCEPKYLAIKFTQMPYETEDGTPCFHDPCKPFPCFRIESHVGMDDSCLVKHIVAKTEQCPTFDEPPPCCGDEEKGVKRTGAAAEEGAAEEGEPGTAEGEGADTATDNAPGG